MTNREKIEFLKELLDQSITIDLIQANKRDILNLCHSKFYDSTYNLFIWSLKEKCLFAKNTRNHIFYEVNIGNINKKLRSIKIDSILNEG